MNGHQNFNQQQQFNQLQQQPSSMMPIDQQNNAAMLQQYMMMMQMAAACQPGYQQQNDFSNAVNAPGQMGQIPLQGQPGNGGNLNLMPLMANWMAQGIQTGMNQMQPTTMPGMDHQGGQIMPQMIPSNNPQQQWDYTDNQRQMQQNNFMAQQASVSNQRQNLINSNVNNSQRSVSSGENAPSQNGLKFKSVAKSVENKAKAKTDPTKKNRKSFKKWTLFQYYVIQKYRSLRGKSQNITYKKCMEEAMTDFQKLSEEELNALKKELDETNMKREQMFNDNQGEDKDKKNESVDALQIPKLHKPEEKPKKKKVTTNKINSFIVFSMMRRAQVKADPQHAKVNDMAANQNFSRQCAQEWKMLTPEEKMKYQLPLEVQKQLKENGGLNDLSKIQEVLSKNEEEIKKKNPAPIEKSIPQTNNDEDMKIDKI